MSRYRLQPSPAQEAALLEHCGHARFVWNLAVEQHAHGKPGRKSAPGFVDQCRQLTDARAEFEWLRTGSVIVQQQALKDFAQAMANYCGGNHRRPTWRRRGCGEGFRIVAVKGGDVRRLSRHVGEVKVPKVGWIRLLRKLARAERGSNRRAKVKAAIARVKARETDRRKDRVEKTSTDLACRFDVIAVEDLKIRNMTRSVRGTVEAPGRNVRAKAGLNRSIITAAWGHLVQRLEHKALGRVVKVNPAYTSQRCSACGIVDRVARESQARYRRRSCGYACNADVHAARNIKHAAGHAVSTREGPRVAGPVHREPQRDLLLVG
ncbi:transposase [Nonomuraea deserti]|uniref:Transposase n=1 Tax=Nonomuraea deserti TaxID=1848322 RepID=A0A4V6PCU2_9ACTN|nr:RNA-guided endonuclease TnpB family protein [Nonomuraea deserti]TDD11206.1 transposase [Nonomuraea deserti]